MRGLTTIVVLAMSAPALGVAADDIGKARQLWQTGKYAEALDAYDALADKAKDDAAKLKIALGRAECFTSTGETDKAIEALGPFAEGEKPSADALAKRADLQFGLGRWEDAEASAQKALKADRDHLLARWVTGRLEEAKGQPTKAIETFKWIVDRRNEKA